MHTATLTFTDDDPRSDVKLTSDLVHIAGALRMMARHLVDTIDPSTAHPTRLHQTADEAEALLVDASRLIGEHQQDRDLRKRVEGLRAAADRFQW